MHEPSAIPGPLIPLGSIVFTWSDVAVCHGCGALGSWVSLDPILALCNLCMISEGYAP